LHPFLFEGAVEEGCKRIIMSLPPLSHPTPTGCVQSEKKKKKRRRRRMGYIMIRSEHPGIVCPFLLSG
jgi:hypothetical protein